MELIDVLSELGGFLVQLFGDFGYATLALALSFRRGCEDFFYKRFEGVPQGLQGCAKSWKGLDCLAHGVLHCNTCMCFPRDFTEIV